MPISITIPTKKCNIEGKYELSFKRKREDIKQVLLKLKEGNKLNQLFPSPIASSLHKQFIEKGYIDSIEVDDLTKSITVQDFIVLVNKVLAK